MATQVADQTSILGLENPMGTDGFEFVEYTAPDIELLRSLFTKMGFPEVARHKSKNVTLHKQADCNFIINAEPGSYAEEYAKAHGPSACAMAFRVKDAKAAHERALETRRDQRRSNEGRRRARHPRYRGDRRLAAVLRRSIRHQWFDLRGRFRLSSRLAAADGGRGFEAHLHRPPDAQREPRPDERVGGFLRASLQLPRNSLFRHRGQADRAILQSDDQPCGKIRIPLNESQDDKSQIEEFLREYKGEGIQHIALGTSNIYDSVDIIRARGIPFQDTPDTYYEMLPERIKGHEESIPSSRSAAF